MSRSAGKIMTRSAAIKAAAARELRRKGVSELTVDINVDSPLWQAEPEAENIVRRAVEEAAVAVSTTAGELAIVLTDDSAIRTLNREWRNKDAATNVLSFPQPPTRASGAMKLLGDIVIAYETTAREAQAEGKPLRNHLAHLAVHGFLHLVGHDHETDQEADTMESLETTILSRLGVPNPYDSFSGQS